MRMAAEAAQAMPTAASRLPFATGTEGKSGKSGDFPPTADEALAAPYREKRLSSRSA